MSDATGFPKFAAGMNEDGMSAREMNRMSNAARKADNLTSGSGVQMRRGGSGNVLSVEPPQGSHILSTTRFVAVVVPPMPLDTTVMVRDVVYAIEDPEPVDLDTNPDDEVVDLVRGEYTYRWGAPGRIVAIPGYGYSPMDFAGGVFEDVDDADTENPTEIRPTVQTTIYWLQLRGQGPPLLWPMGEGQAVEFAVVRSIGDPDDENFGNDLFVTVEGVKRTPEGWELSGEPIEIATYPWIPSRYYEPFIWDADELDPPHTPLLRVFTVGGDTYLEQTARWAFIKVDDTVRLSDCTPIARITEATP